MLTRIGSLLLLFHLGCSPAAAAETMYVVDKLRVGIYKDEELSGPPLNVVPTGTKLEVLERAEKKVKVVDPEGKTGWVDASYLMAEEPALLVAQKLKKEIEDLQQTLSSREIKLAQVRSQSSDTNTKNNSASEGAQLQQLLEENQALKQALEQEWRLAPRSMRARLQSMLRIDFLIILTVLSAIAFLSGVYTMDYRQRKRHGGFRI